MGGTSQQLEGSAVQKGKAFGILLFLVALGWLNNVVFCVLQVIAVRSSATLMDAGGLCHGASVFFRQLNQGALDFWNAVLLKPPRSALQVYVFTL